MFDKVAEFSAGGQLESSSGQLGLTYVSEFPDAGNSKIGELEAENSMRGTRYLPISDQK